MPPVALFRMQSASLANVPLLIVITSGLSRHVIDIVLSLSGKGRYLNINNYSHYHPLQLDPTCTFLQQIGLPCLHDHWQHSKIYMPQAFLPCPHPAWLPTHNEVGTYYQQGLSLVNLSEPFPCMHVMKSRTSGDCQHK